jgi:hypothetical protein
LIYNKNFIRSRDDKQDNFSSLLENDRKIHSLPQITFPITSCQSVIGCTFLLIRLTGVSSKEDF